MKTCFWCDLQKGLCFPANFGRHFCPDFQGFYPDFQRFCSNLQRFCPNFQQIKTFRGALAPSPPTPLVSKALWTLIQQKLDPQISEPYTIDILGGHTSAMPRISLWLLRAKSLQLEFSKQSLCHFLIRTRNECSVISDPAFHKLLDFCTRYLCETVGLFSKLITKCKNWSFLRMSFVLYQSTNGWSI